MPACSVKGCKNRSENAKKNKISLFTFPKVENIAAKWAKACGKNVVNLKYARICSIHFTPKCYKEIPEHLKGLDLPKGSVRPLLPNAVPTENLIFDEARGALQEVNVCIKNPEYTADMDNLKNSSLNVTDKRPLCTGNKILTSTPLKTTVNSNISKDNAENNISENVSVEILNDQNYKSMNISTSFNNVINENSSDMGKSCSVEGCPVYVGQGFYMPYFPKDPERRKVWKKKVNCNLDWSPGKTGVLCELHFEEDQFEQIKVDGTKKLKSCAVPTKFLTNTASATNFNSEIKKQSLTEHSYASGLSSLPSVSAVSEPSPSRPAVSTADRTLTDAEKLLATVQNELKEVKEENRMYKQKVKLLDRYFFRIQQIHVLRHKLAKTTMALKRREQNRLLREKMMFPNLEKD